MQTAAVLNGAKMRVRTLILALRHLLGWMFSAFRSREDLVLENLALLRPEVRDGVLCFSA
jgi:hypothetical protein